MKIFKRIILLSALIFAQAHAYDIDTHFYSTAAVLIKRGVKKEVAYKLAAYAQWIDESGLTTPMTTERKRRLFHFPTPLMLKKVPKPSAQEVSEFLEQMEKQTNEVLAKKGNFKDRVHGKNMGVLAEVIENNPMAYDIMKKGLATGDFVLVGAGIHILMDSYGHSGFTPFEGHAHAGHDPDAPYKHVEKYYRMLQTAFKVTTVLLNALPEEAIDRTATFTDKNGQVRLSAEASADDVYESFINDPDVKRAIEYNIQRSPDYTRVAIGTILASMTQAGIIKDSSILKAIISDEDTFTRGKSTEEIMEEIVGAILAKGQDEASKILDLSELSDDYLREISMHLSIPDYIKNAGGVEAGAKRIALVITRRFVAHNMDANHQFVMDPEGPPREKEMSMRIDAWQNVIQKLTGDRVLFDAGTSLGAYIKKTVMERFKSKAKSNNPDFKALSEAEVAGLEKGVEAIKIGVNYKEQAAWNWKMFNIVYIDFLRYVQIKWNFKLGWNWLESLPGSHNVIDPEVYFIQNEQQFKNALANGSFKKFISPAEVQMLEEQFAERQALANGTKLMCESIFK